MIKSYTVTFEGACPEILDEDELCAYCMALVLDEPDWDFDLSLEEVMALDTDNLISITEN